MRKESGRLKLFGNRAFDAMPLAKVDVIFALDYNKVTKKITMILKTKFRPKLNLR